MTDMMFVKVPSQHFPLKELSFSYSRVRSFGDSWGRRQKARGRTFPLGQAALAPGTGVPPGLNSGQLHWPGEPWFAALHSEMILCMGFAGSFCPSHQAGG